MSNRTLPTAVGEKFVLDPMRIQGNTVDTHLGEMEHGRLSFFVDNPRVYSIVRENGKSPSQEEIQEKLEEMEHVRTLIQDIRKHGGLIDPLVVKDCSLEVVEGNSRLAAYRVLARQNPSKWARVKCRLLPADINEQLIAALLGQWHLKGKKEWPPYEQAGYLYRRHRQQKVSLPALAIEAGVGSVRVGKIIEAYELMIDQNDTKRDRWSYYDEFVKSRTIAKVCEAQPEFRARVLSMVKRDEFTRAADLRDKLPVICKASPRIRARFASGKLDLHKAYEAAKEAGGGHGTYQRLHKFRVWMADQDTQDQIANLDAGLRDRVEFELRKLQGLVASMLKRR